MPAALMLEPLNHATAQSVAPVAKVLVVDSTGKTVSEAISMGGPAGATVALDVAGELVVLQVTRQAFLGNALVPLFFESTDCSGTAFAPAGQLSLGSSLTIVAVTNPEGTVYLGDPGAVAQIITSRSAYLSDPNGTGRCDVNTTAVDDAVPVEPLVDLYDLFSPPFHLAAAPTVTATGTATPTVPSTATPTTPLPPSSTPSVPVVATNTPTAPLPVLTSTPTPGAGIACCGDCNGNGAVTIEELITAVNHDLNGCP